jgi:serine/threonine protein kinase
MPHIYSLRDFITVKDSQKVLGTGSYGEVQLVQRKGTREFYAQKIYKKSMLTSLIPLKVLFREISLHMTLIHPNIVRLYDHMEDHIKLYLIMEYVEKGSLFDLLRKKGRLSEREAWKIFTQTCVGLEYLHSKNVLHRDLKPENILISKDDSVKICDFGWSAHGTDNRVTFCGTLDYMSPEMLNKQPQTYKVDIWAVGILLYEMLHAAPPFRGKNPKDMARLVSEKCYNFAGHVSENAKVIISALLQDDPVKRPDILDVLKFEWVQMFADELIRPGWTVKHKGFGNGIILDVVGLVARVNFEGNEKELIVSNLVHECKVTNDNGVVVYWGEFQNEAEPPAPKVLKGKSGSRSQKVIKPLQSNKLPTNTSSQALSPLPRSPKPTEEVKSSKALPKKEKTDFESINLALPSKPEKKPIQNKSRFLQRFKKDPQV